MQQKKSCRNKKVPPVMRGFFILQYKYIGNISDTMVGAAGFEPATSCSQGRRANQAALRPDPFLGIEALTYHLRLFSVKEKG
jgi:hypothetical protein